MVNERGKLPLHEHFVLGFGSASVCLDGFNNIPRQYQQKANRPLSIMRTVVRISTSGVSIQKHSIVCARQIQIVFYTEQVRNYNDQSILLKRIACHWYTATCLARWIEINTSLVVGSNSKLPIILSWSCSCCSVIYLHVQFMILRGVCSYHVNQMFTDVSRLGLVSEASTPSPSSFAVFCLPPSF